jgi:hypothetical protein
MNMDLNPCTYVRFCWALMFWFCYALNDVNLLWGETIFEEHIKTEAMFLGIALASLIFIPLLSWVSLDEVNWKLVLTITLAAYILEGLGLYLLQKRAGPISYMS